MTDIIDAERFEAVCDQHDVALSEVAHQRQRAERAEEQVRVLREALTRSDSMLSLLRHRQATRIDWGSWAGSIPTQRDVDEVIGQSRNALARTEPQ